MKTIEKIKLASFLRRHRFKNAYQPREDDGKLALLWCAEHNALDHAKRILAFYPEALNITDDSGNTALHIAAMFGYEQMVRFFVDKNPNLVRVKNDSGFFPLHCAIIYNQTSNITNFLIDQAPEVLAEKTSNGSLAIHFAASRDKTALCEKILSLYPDQLNAKDNNENTPLSKAGSDDAKSRTARMLLEKDLVGTFRELPEQLFEADKEKSLNNIVAAVEDVIAKKFPDRENITKEENDIRNAIKHKCVFERILIENNKIQEEKKNKAQERKTKKKLMQEEKQKN